MFVFVDVPTFQWVRKTQGGTHERGLFFVAFLFFFNVFLIRDMRSCYMFGALACYTPQRIRICHSDTQNWMPYNILRQLPSRCLTICEINHHLQCVVFDIGACKRPSSSWQNRIESWWFKFSRLKINLLPKRKGSSSNHPFSGGKICC